mmetsp:Transcript_109477/g.339862  ORF Transcript_109477/g.339862 Transcript_109477/m.339862 type:complete len:203 (+) Transcript_109477:392-1000(+)
MTLESCWLVRPKPLLAMTLALTAAKAPVTAGAGSSTAATTGSETAAASAGGAELDALLASWASPTASLEAGAWATASPAAPVLMGAAAAAPSAWDKHCSASCGLERSSIWQKRAPSARCWQAASLPRQRPATFSWKALEASTRLLTPARSTVDAGPRSVRAAAVEASRTRRPAPRIVAGLSPQGGDATSLAGKLGARARLST